MDERTQMAIEKLKNEEVIPTFTYLKQIFMPVIEGDAQLVEGILNPLKSFKTCFNYINKWAMEESKKENNGKMQSGYGAPDDVFVSQMIHYFTEVEEKPVPKPEPKPMPKPELKKPAAMPKLKSKENKTEVEEISLF